MQGTWSWWYPNGDVAMSGEYIAGSPTGTWTWETEEGDGNMEINDLPTQMWVNQKLAIWEKFHKKK
jgi:antitoxin component YwqK of YwqJK toxin-antitoxin module